MSLVQRVVGPLVSLLLGATPVMAQEGKVDNAACGITEIPEGLSTHTREKPTIDFDKAIDFNAAFQNIRASQVPVIVDISSFVCPPCKKLDPVLTAAVCAANKDGIRIRLVKAWDYMGGPNEGGVYRFMDDLTGSAGVPTPTILVYNRGRQIYNQAGLGSFGSYRSVDACVVKQFVQVAINGKFEDTFVNGKRKPAAWERCIKKHKSPPSSGQRKLRLG